MKTHTFAFGRGLDVVSPEGGLPDGAVREADNIVLLTDGRGRQRPGYGAPIIPLAGAHSHWQSAATKRVFVAAQDTLYEVDLAAQAVSPLFTGLPIEQPVEYIDVGPDTYFTAGGILRKVTAAGVVRRPGVADLSAMAPLVISGAGTFRSGRYAVAYSLINDLGEESGVSRPTYIDLTGPAGIVLGGIAIAADVTRMRLYVSDADGTELYPHSSAAVASAITLSDPRKDGEVTKRTGKMPMPGGSIVRHFRGRLYVVQGKWVWISDPLDYGLCDMVGGWMSFNRTIKMLEPVEAGIFVGLRERTIFLRGRDQADFVYENASTHGALGTGTPAPADFFNADLVPDQAHPVAAWMSGAGIAIGRADGSIAYPQEARITLDGTAFKPAFFTHEGAKQSLSFIENMSLGAGGGTDITT